MVVKTLCYKNFLVVLLPTFDFAEVKLYTGCPRWNVQDFGRAILMLNYTDITQNTYVQSRTVTEIMAREKCGFHRSRRTICRP